MLPGARNQVTDEPAPPVPTEAELLARARCRRRKPVVQATESVTVNRAALAGA